MRAAILIVAALLGGCTTAQAGRGPDDAAEFAEELAGRIAGAPQRCIPLTQSSSPRIVGERLLYTEGRKLWVNEPVGGCPSLGSDVIPIIEVNGGSQLCENDRFRTVQRGGIGIPGPYCRLGPFVLHQAVVVAALY